MKLSTLTAKLTETKAVRALALTAVAGAALMMAAPKAQAQFSWGVQVGTPVYVDPAPTVVYQQPGYYNNGYYNNGYYNNGYYNGDRYAAWRAHEAHEQWERHEAWEHARRFDRDDDRGFYGRGYDHERFEHRDHDRW